MLLILLGLLALLGGCKKEDSAPAAPPAEDPATQQAAELEEGPVAATADTSQAPAELPDIVEDSAPAQPEGPKYTSLEAQAEEASLNAAQGLLSKDFVPRGSLVENQSEVIFLAVGSPPMPLIVAPERIPNGICEQPKAEGQWWLFPSEPVVALQLSEVPHFWVYDAEATCLRAWPALAPRAKLNGAPKLHLEYSPSGGEQRADFEFSDGAEGPEALVLNASGFAIQNAKGEPLFDFKLADATDIAAPVSPGALQASSIELFEKGEVGYLRLKARASQDGNQDPQVEASEEWVWQWYRRTAAPLLIRQEHFKKHSSRTEKVQKSTEENEVIDRFGVANGVLMRRLSSARANEEEERSEDRLNALVGKARCDTQAKIDRQLRSKRSELEWRLISDDGEFSLSDVYPPTAGLVIAEIEKEIAEKELRSLGFLDHSIKGEVANALEGNEEVSIGASEAKISSNGNVVFQHPFDPCPCEFEATQGALTGQISVDRLKHDRSIVNVNVDLRLDNKASGEFCHCREESETFWSPTHQEILNYAIEHETAKVLPCP